jgi:pantoate--beta-alanine ligase
MILFKKGTDLRKWLDIQQSSRKNLIGFVPTMGALHAGHVSLVEASGKRADITVCSIFVNPTQFNDPADLEKYPVTLEKDIDRLEEAGCDVLFLPSTAEIYPEGMDAAKKIRYNLGTIEQTLEGEFRPGHYQGVAMVVDRLLDRVDPDLLFLGQKDYQQCLVIRRLLEITGKGTEMVIVPTAREQNGLAMSSRNERLSSSERETASAIFRTLSGIRSGVTAKKKTGELIAKAFDQLRNAGLEPEYFAVANANDLTPVDQWNGEKDAVILAAAWMNRVRLIDNVYLEAIV